MTRRTFLNRLSAAFMGVVAAVYVPSMPWETKPKPYPRFRNYTFTYTKPVDDELLKEQMRRAWAKLPKAAPQPPSIVVQREVWDKLKLEHDPHSPALFMTPVMVVDA